MTREWKDATSYSRGERGYVEPRAWVLKNERLRVMVHRYHGIAGWRGTCDALCLSAVPLGDDLDTAKRDFLARVIAEADALCHAARELGGE